MSVETLTLADIENYDPRPRRRGKRLRAKCPLHRGDHQQSLSINVETGWGKCFACGATVWVSDFAPMGAKNRWRVEQTPRRRTISSPAPSPASTSLKELEKMITALAGTPGADYLKMRGIPPALAERYGVKYIKKGCWPGRAAARAWPRLAFPLATPDGVVNYYSRAASKDAPREGAHDVLPGPKGYFNFEALGCDMVYVCEAALDALSLAAAGADNVVGLIGTHFRPEWFLAAGTKKIILALDRDEPGQKAAAEIALKAALAGLACEVLPEECYGGEKDLNAAWQAGRLVLPGLGERTLADRRKELSDAAFWQRVDETRQALLEFPVRTAAFCQAWARELSYNPPYPDAPAGGENNPYSLPFCGALTGED